MEVLTSKVDNIFFMNIERVKINFLGLMIDGQFHENGPQNAKK